MRKILSIILVVALALFMFACKREKKIGSKTFDISKIHTVCIAQSAEDAALDGMRKGFVVGMKDLGLLEDVNVKYIYENAKNNANYAKQIADSFAEKKPDLVVAIGSLTATAMQQKFNDTDVPVVFMGCANAEKLGFCTSDNKPVGNMTGVVDSHLIDEKLTFIEKNYPDIKRLGIIYDANNPLSQYDVDYHKFYATAHNIDIYTVSIKKSEDIVKALDNILPKVHAITLIVDDMVSSEVKQVVDRCSKENKLVFGETDDHEKAGCIVATQRDYQLIGRDAANLAKQILVDGKKAKDLDIVYLDFKIN